MSSILYNAAPIQHIREVVNPQPKRSYGAIELQSFFNETGQMVFAQSITGEYSRHDNFRHSCGPQKSKILKELVKNLSKIPGFDRTEFPAILETAFLNLKREERVRAVVLAKLIAENPESIIWASEGGIEERIDISGQLMDIVTENLAKLSLGNTH